VAKISVRASPLSRLNSGLVYMINNIGTANIKYVRISLHITQGGFSSAKSFLPL
jgi:hypothetical protein